LEILIRHRLSDEAMERLNHDFSSLLTNEIIAQAPYAGTEVTPPCSSLHGLSLSPHERRIGELRRLIDAINSANRAHPSA
jgi:hypothetical protein